jgi:acetyltransferase-like isoleucine patch superfamily enzyme
LNPIECVDQLYEHWVCSGATNKLFSDLRYRYYKNKLKQSNPFFSSTGFYIMTPSHVCIGENCFFNRNVYLGAIPDDDRSQITIGNDCNFGINVVVVAADHPLHDVSKPMRRNNSVGGNIIIGDDCWIGSNVTITKDVEIGEGSVVGANSVVTHDIPSYAIFAGCPAVEINRR